MSLHIIAARRLPAPVQLPALAARGPEVLALGGLDDADASVAGVVHVAPGRARAAGALPEAVHDAGAAALGGRVYVFGGGTAAGPTGQIVEVGRGIVGHLPEASSDLEAVRLRGSILVVGGYTGTQPQRSVLAFAPGRPLRPVATLPHPLRYAAAAAAGGALLVAGGTDGSRARREIIRVDPVRHRARVLGRLPVALAHVAGAVLGRTFFVFGGRGDGAAGPRRTIWAVDTGTGRVRAAGLLPLALSDASAITVGGRIILVGGRTASGSVSDRVFELALHAPRRLDVYAAGRPGLLSPVVAHDPALVYVPNSGSNSVDVLSQRTGRVVRRFATGALPQHVTPSWDLRTLWISNDRANQLTPVDPRTGRPGRPVPVADPYNLYFTADGRRAIVVAEALRRLDFRDPHTMRLRDSLPVPQCAGVDHMDLTAGGRLALVSCEFAARMIVVDLQRERVLKTIPLRPGAMPQDVKLSPDGRTFYVADMAANGVWLIDARTWRRIRLQPTGAGAHGLYPSRDSRRLFVTNRGEGTISVLSFRTGRPLRKWRIPGPASPDMGGVSADGRVLWLSGRYNAEVYAISTRTGRLLHRVPVGSGPHGLCVWPQPGRYSIGHTGILR